MHNSNSGACIASGKGLRASVLDGGNTDLSSDVFEPGEIAELADLCARCTDARWARRRGQAGEDVIEIELGGGRPGSIWLRKTNGAYAATGFGGWRLALFEDLTALITALAHRPRRPSAPLPLAELG
jgi:hypothetical protein